MPAMRVIVVTLTSEGFMRIILAMLSTFADHQQWQTPKFNAAYPINNRRGFAAKDKRNSKKGKHK